MAALCLASCRSKNSASTEPAQRMEGVRLSEQTLGRPAWRLKARQASLERGDSMALLSQPKIQFFENGREVSEACADSARIDTANDDVTLSSGVVVRSLKDSTTLRTESLHYSSARKRFFSDQDVLVRRPGGIMRGRGLEASADLSDIRVFRQRTRLKRAPR
ncbi:MAG: LPS export ABC transporter periplasmic protein LptC [Elusimicrobia bacterium]|nr:LPS export ABC transporter periplasmic protein LptC [Elusimicrobiota bacterium]